MITKIKYKTTGIFLKHPFYRFLDNERNEWFKTHEYRKRWRHDAILSLHSYLAQPSVAWLLFLKREPSRSEGWWAICPKTGTPW